MSWKYKDNVLTKEEGFTPQADIKKLNDWSLDQGSVLTKTKYASLEW
ncbi:hypothetical protein KT99_02982 [Shewanella benthica KT99]|uniref:Uncharacterized protein n=1 Tax=Shewanella benthica KT99 TaxID=314608 RepID=A9CYA9_9GAMM|nr:hypothetical protein KT99_02982 [Shewanella benthica KT99]